MRGAEIMALYINHEKHKDIYKNEAELREPNQGYFMHNHTAEMIKEQKRINHHLHQSFNSLKKGYAQQESRGRDILSQLKELHAGQLSTQEVITELSTITGFYESIVHQMENDVLATNEIKQQMEEQLELQKQIQEQLLQQKENQKEVNERLENQEALTEKVVRQIDYLRAIIFERTNDLTEKIEEGFRLTSAYVHYITTSRDQFPLNFMLYRKQEKE